MSDWRESEVAQRLGLRVPIIQGPFGGGLSSVELVVAVSEAGGLGSFGANPLGAAQIRTLGVDIRARTKRPFALNLWVSTEDPGGEGLSAEQYDAAVAHFRPYYDALGLPPPPPPERYGQRFSEQIDALLEVRPAVFSFIFGIPAPEVLAACRHRQITTIGTATTVDEALALEAAGVDMVVATGMEAGGHRASFLRSAEESLSGGLALIPTMADRLKVPIIAAGGIADGRGIAAAFTLGAKAVQIGTAFLACEESNASALHRAALWSDRARDTVLTRVFSGRLARGIRNRFVEEESRRGAPLPYPIQNWFTGTWKAAAIAQGRSDLLSMWAGQAAPLIRHHFAADVLRALEQETSRILSR